MPLPPSQRMVFVEDHMRRMQDVVWDEGPVPMKTVRELAAAIREVAEVVRQLAERA